MIAALSITGWNQTMAAKIIAAKAITADIRRNIKHQRGYRPAYGEYVPCLTMVRRAADVVSQLHIRKRDRAHSHLLGLISEIFGNTFLITPTEQPVRISL
jgi:hypothetical protein